MRGSTTPPRPARLRDRAVGLTYLELVITLVMASLLMGAVMSATLAISRQESFGQSRLRATNDYAEVLARLTEELLTATDVSQQSTDELQITVPDRDDDSSEEIITYQLAGDELQRTQNQSAAVTVARGLADAQFLIDATKFSVGDPGVEEDVVLGYFDGYEGMEGYDYDCDGAHAGPASWLSQYLQLDGMDQVDRFDITRCSLRMQWGGGPASGTVTLSIYAANPATHTPAGPALDTATVKFSGVMPLTPTWHDFEFGSLRGLPAGNYEICLVVSASPDKLALVSYCNYSWDTGPDDGTELHWTDDGGGTWYPQPSDWDEWDVRFYLYGDVYGGAGGMAQPLDCRGVTVQLVPEDGLPCVRYVRLANHPMVGGLKGP